MCARLDALTFQYDNPCRQTARRGQDRLPRPAVNSYTVLRFRINSWIANDSIRLSSEANNEKDLML